MKLNNTIILRELRRIAAEHRGVLLPEIVVAAARPTTSPLHNRFEWNDSDAAHEYRLWQARHLIREVVVHLRVNGEIKPVNVFVSLKPDREGEGGYREIVAVLENKDFRTQMLADALDELRTFQAKYAHLKELASLWKPIAKVLKSKQKA
jgi:hypothetical protein